MPIARTRPADPPAPAPVPSLSGRAAEDLRAIRSSMDRASLFTAVPGRGGMLLGAAVASRQLESGAWLRAWILTAAVGVVVGIAAIARSARAEGQPLLGPTG